MRKILITGIASPLGRLLARRLAASWTVCGVDASAWAGRPREIATHVADLRKREFEEVMRSERPAAVVHLGVRRDMRGDARARHDVNVRGTKRLLDHCAAFGVRQLVVISTSTVYGAAPENPLYMREDEPLSASRSYPEIRDRVEVDALASAFVWRVADVRTAVLRPVHVLGPHSTGMLADYLRRLRPPTVLGYDPLMQVIHEADWAESIALALTREVRGIFNVIGSGQVPLRTAIAEMRSEPFAMPEFAMRPWIRAGFATGLLPWPEGAIDYLKFPVTVSGDAFVEATGWKPLFSLKEIFAAHRERRSEP
ncbi:MAG TPA: NAD-dependent epimerase/dehydratase family protein [Myxococcota bacterium]|jgi:UDP-glucose 4-epimerase